MPRNRKAIYKRWSSWNDRHQHSFHCGDRMQRNCSSERHFTGGRLVQNVNHIITVLGAMLGSLLVRSILNRWLVMVEVSSRSCGPSSLVSKYAVAQGPFLNVGTFWTSHSLARPPGEGFLLVSLVILFLFSRSSHGVRS